jgi:hypothetical protein
MIGVKFPAAEEEGPRAFQHMNKKHTRPAEFAVRLAKAKIFITISNGQRDNIKKCQRVGFNL